MDEEERDCVGVLGGLVEVVDVYFLKAIGFQGLVVIRELVEFGFLCTPVETSLPVFGQAFDIGERRSIDPAGIIELEQVLLARWMKVLRER